MEVLRLFQSSSPERCGRCGCYHRGVDCGWYADMTQSRGLADVKMPRVYDAEDDPMARPARPMLKADLMPQDPAEPVQRCYYSRYKGWVVSERPRPVLLEDL